MTPHDQRSYDQAQSFMRLLQHPPAAAAVIAGSPHNPAVSGTLHFYQTPLGVCLLTQIFGLPVSEDPCVKQIFAFHIHSGDTCSGTAEDPFADVLTHYNPDNCPHPQHAGDLAPLFATHSGYAFEILLTDRFSVDEIIGKTIVIHRDPDDFTTQPSGNAGEKIACGEIQRYRPFRF